MYEYELLIFMYVCITLTPSTLSLEHVSGNHTICRFLLRSSAEHLICILIAYVELRLGTELLVLLLLQSD